MEEQLSSIDILHHKAEPCVSLEGELEGLGQVRSGERGEGQRRGREGRGGVGTRGGGRGRGGRKNKSTITLKCKATCHFTKLCITGMIASDGVYWM